MLRHLYHCALFLVVGGLLVPYTLAKFTYEQLGAAIDRILDLLEV